MGVRIENYLGALGFNARKYLPHLASSMYLKLQYITRRKDQKAYIDYFMSLEEAPHPNVVNLETINRCNSTCDFCCANKNADQRPFAKMSDELFKNIIDQLAEWGYKNKLTLYGNNEPWMDTRIVELHKYAREKLPDCFIFMSTNGLLLTPEKVEQIAPYIDQLIINNYAETMDLQEPHQKVYDYLMANQDKYKDLDVVFQIRYIHEILTNRAGAAPNKAQTQKVITETCLMPFTDMFIVPDGRMCICCCDNREVTTMGDLTKTTLKEAWNSKAYNHLRECMRNGRHNHPFCKHCDFIDKGLRDDIVKDKLNKK